MAETFYPGIGADDAQAELFNLVGQITASWASIEDQLFQVFVIALAGRFRLLDNRRPYRAVFFTFSSYEGKMRMTHNAMKARYAGNEIILAEWDALRKLLDGFAQLRNEVAHLVPTIETTKNPEAPANVRLIPPLWKSVYDTASFDSTGYSLEQLWKALAPYWGYHPLIHGLSPPAGDSSYQLSFRLQEFGEKIEKLNDPPPVAPSGT